MAPLTWRNVDAPDLGRAAEILNAAAANWNSGFDSIGEALGMARESQIKNRSASALNTLASVRGSADVEPALAQLFGSIRPEDMTPELQAAILNLRTTGFNLDAANLKAGGGRRTGGSRSGGRTGSGTTTGGGDEKIGKDPAVNYLEQVLARAAAGSGNVPGVAPSPGPAAVPASVPGGSVPGPTGVGTPVPNQNLSFGSFVDPAPAQDPAAPPLSFGGQTTPSTASVKAWESVRNIVGFNPSIPGAAPPLTPAPGNAPGNAPATAIAPTLTPPVTESVTPPVASGGVPPVLSVPAPLPAPIPDAAPLIAAAAAAGGDPNVVPNRVPPVFNKGEDPYYTMGTSLQETNAELAKVPDLVADLLRRNPNASFSDVLTFGDAQREAVLNTAASKVGLSGDLLRLAIEFDDRNRVEKVRNEAIAAAEWTETVLPTLTPENFPALFDQISAAPWSASEKQAARDALYKSYNELGIQIDLNEDPDIPEETKSDINTYRRSYEHFRKVGASDIYKLLADFKNSGELTGEDGTRSFTESESVHEAIERVASKHNFDIPDILAKSNLVEASRRLHEQTDLPYDIIVDTLISDSSYLGRKYWNSWILFPGANDKFQWKYDEKRALELLKPISTSEGYDKMARIVDAQESRNEKIMKLESNLTLYAKTVAELKSRRTAITRPDLEAEISRYEKLFENATTEHGKEVKDAVEVFRNYGKEPDQENAVIEAIKNLVTNSRDAVNNYQRPDITPEDTIVTGQGQAGILKSAADILKEQAANTDDDAQVKLLNDARHFYLGTQNRSVIDGNPAFLDQVKADPLRAYLDTLPPDLQEEHGGVPVVGDAIPLYLNLDDPRYAGTLVKRTLESPEKFDEFVKKVDDWTRNFDQISEFERDRIRRFIQRPSMQKFLQKNPVELRDFIRSPVKYVEAYYNK